jgi:4-hydroxybenzoate polyprenyltransferase
MKFLKKILPFAHLARWHKPSPSLLLFLPGSWSIAASTYALNFPITDAIHTTTLFAAGAFLMRGAGCTINDLWDKDLDKHVIFAILSIKVERTQSRPLAAGALSPFQAICFLGLQLSAGLAILLQLNTYR